MHSAHSLSERPGARVEHGGVRAVRSTLLCFGLQELRARNRIDDYRRALPTWAHAAIFEAVAGVWLPIEVVMAHFGACESLDMSAQECFDIGGASGRRLSTSSLGALARMATQVGASPSTVLAVYHRLWSRVFDGGVVDITTVGPKEAIIAYRDLPFAKFAYCQHTLRGANDSAFRLVAKTLYLRALPGNTDDSFALRLSWV
jgi:hypothetical protein